MHVTAYNFVFLLGICIIKSDSNIGSNITINISKSIYDCCLYSTHMRARAHIHKYI